jgi:hypothetical protein
LSKNSPWLAEKFTIASGKIHFGWWKKNSTTTGGTICSGQWKNPPGLAEKSAMFGRNSRSGGKLQAMLCENFPRKFRRRQVVVLRHALSDQELSEILFAVCLCTYVQLKIQSQGLSLGQPSQIAPVGRG